MDVLGNVSMNIRLLTRNDAKDISGIYNYYIYNSIATFEESEVTIEDMAKRLEKIKQKHIGYVYEKEGSVLGYAYIDEFKGKSAYRKTCESTIYIKSDSLNLGIGRKLYSSLIASAREMNLHALVAVLACPNECSEKFHSSMGFSIHGRLKEVGYKFNKFIDISYWQLIL